MKSIKFKIGDSVLYRYSKSAKWKEGRIKDIDFSRKLPYGIEFFVNNKINGKRWCYDFRVNESNLNQNKNQ